MTAIAKSTTAAVQNHCLPTGSLGCHIPTPVFRMPREAPAFHPILTLGRAVSCFPIQRLPTQSENRARSARPSPMRERCSASSIDLNTSAKEPLSGTGNAAFNIAPSLSRSCGWGALIKGQSIMMAISGPIERTLANPVPSCSGMGSNDVFGQ